MPDNDTNNNSLHQDAINAAVWSACDTFRGTVDPSIYKDYVLTMLFLKYISDIWQDHYERYRKEHGDHPELIRELLKNERFVLPEPANFYALHAQRHLPGNGERIDKALHLIEEANLSKLHDVFQDISFNATKLGDEAQKNDILRHLLEDFARPELNMRESRIGNLDVIGNAYEFLIKNFASTSGKKAGEFYTPPEVSQLMARLMEPREGDELCDPTCGSGSLLMKCAQLIRSSTGRRNYRLYGQEAIGSTWALAKMNLFLHAEDSHRVEWGDTLRNPKLLDAQGNLKQFDIVVANPPFSLEKWGHESAAADPFKRFRRGIPPRTKADYAFILHMVETMKPVTGRMAVVVPHGVLFRSAAEGRIRQKLVDENLLDVVIGLPEKLFYGTGIPAAILLLRRAKIDDKVLFIDASRAYQDGKNQNMLRPQDLDAIEATVRARRSVERFATLADRANIADNSYNLNISRYVTTYQEAEPLDMRALYGERRIIKRDLAKIDERIEGYMEELGYV
jgi:type I restriction enzyme M protein